MHMIIIANGSTKNPMCHPGSRNEHGPAMIRPLCGIPANSASVAAPSAAPGASAAPEAGTGLNEQQEIVILSVSAQQAEVIRYGQLMANPLLTLSLVLRSPDDFIDPTTGEPVPPVIAETTGITLKELIDGYGVLPPTIEQPVLPSIRP